MSKSKPGNADSNGAILLSDGTDPRIITPENPLIIDYTPANFQNLEIQGGSIYSNVDAKVNIALLTKNANA